MPPQEAISSQISVVKLRTEHLENPLGIDSRQPRLSWQVSGEGRGLSQSAYQIQVAKTPILLEMGENNLLWDSGKVLSDNTLSVPYQGPELNSTWRYYWHVKVWDQNNHPSGWSEKGWWEMGLLNEEEWQPAEWIEVGWDEKPKAFNPCPFLRRSFQLPQMIRWARLYITAHGLYEAWINGQRVGDQIFTPGYTAYDKRLQYQAYDVTDLLYEGENAMGVILGDGWYRGKVYVNEDRNVYGERLGLLALIQIELRDGSRMILSSDSQWKSATGPILKSDMKDGEIYDARLEMPGWNDLGFNDSRWKPVRVASHPKNHLVASMGVPVRQKETFTPILLKTPGGETVLDFGQNLAGIVHFKVQGPKGTTIRLRHGETLDENGNFTQANLFALKSKGKEPFFQEVRYTLKGQGVEEYEPKFTVHGFRYAQLEGYPGEPRPEDFCAVAIYSDMPPTGSFECSDPMINQLHHNTEWSMKSNFLDLPTDCPTREQAGWTGDAQIFTPSASFLMDTQAFLRKWLTELRDEQFEDGKVGNFVPNPYRLKKSFLNKLDGSCGWGDVAVMMPWALYQAFGDTSILEEQYESMKAWINYAASQAMKTNRLRKSSPKNRVYIWDTGYHWGEWLEPGTGGFNTMAASVISRVFLGAPTVATAYFANSTRLLAQISEVLGKQAEAHGYRTIAESIKTAYAEEFIGLDGRMDPDIQASYTRVLAFDLAPAELKPAIVGHLVRLIRAAGNHLGTGFLSTPYLLHVLADNGHLDLAYELLNQKTAPSWLYEISKGATTIWESWEGIDENGKPSLSLNHYSPGSVVNFLHCKVAGLEAAEPGYRTINIRPRPGGGLTWAKATYDSVRGPIASEWNTENGLMRLNVTVPANTRASVTLPGAVLGSVMENGVPLASVEGLSNPVQIGVDVRCEIGSGIYRFEYPLSGN